MNKFHNMACRGWEAIASGLQTKTQWLEWMQGDRTYSGDDGWMAQCKRVPPKFRRRCTRLTRLVLESLVTVADRTGLDLGAANVVYASKHGEISVLDGLFSLMGNHETLSPIDFCNSVHHTPTGYLSMIWNNTGISRTVSAGNNTFVSGLLEVFSLLNSQPQGPVVLIMADERVPDIFAHPPSLIDFPYSISMVFETPSGVVNNFHSVLTLERIRELWDRGDNGMIELLQELSP